MPGNKVKLRSYMRKYSRFLPFEDRFIVGYFRAHKNSVHTITEIAKYLGRSRDGVINRMIILKNRNTRNHEIGRTAERVYIQ